MNVLIIHGPAGSGKTHHREEIRRAFGMRGIVDGWEPGDPLLDRHVHLTCWQPNDAWKAAHPGVTVLGIRLALSKVAGGAA